MADCLSYEQLLELRSRNPGYANKKLNLQFAYAKGIILL